MLKKAAVKNGKVKPCLNSPDGTCPCPNHTGELNYGPKGLEGLSCESRKMHKPPVK